MGLSSYGPKTPGWRNRLTLSAVQSITFSSPSNIRLSTTIPPEMSVVDQEPSIDVFISTTRPLQKKGQHTINQTDGAHTEICCSVVTTVVVVIIIMLLVVLICCFFHFRNDLHLRLLL